jgi:hypothetical protein
MTKEEELLRSSMISDDVYIVGGFVSGVTVYKQQVRALNLVWSLVQTKKYNPKTSNVAVIGGGIAGLTAASAFLSKGLRNLHLFERRAMLCPLQQGCDIRWLHPHIYDWPDPGSNRRVAGLPLMNWEEGRASDVAYNLINEWSRRVSRAKVSGTNVKQTLSITHLILDRNHKIEWVGTTDGQPDGNCKEFDIIVLAVGFGEEASANKKYKAISYWRNEDFGQQRLSVDQKQSILISGTGDGGLIDLLRVRLGQFRQDTIIDELFPKQNNKVIPILQQLKNEYSRIPEGQHFDRLRSTLNSVENELEAQLIDVIRQRLRGDTYAALHIRPNEKNPRTINSIFGSKSSFLNNVLVYLLYAAGGFTPIFVDSTEKISEIDSFNHLIIRHGTDRMKAIQRLLSDELCKHVEPRLKEME